TSFFFQAEDGIRDSSVTGVQTCALPIWPRGRLRRTHLALQQPGRRRAPEAGRRPGGGRGRDVRPVLLPRRQLDPRHVLPAAVDQIGRASCRQSVSISERGRWETKVMALV